MKTKLENPTNMDELTKQFNWLEVLEKSKETFNVLWNYIAKGLGILFVKGEIFPKKWYNLFGILKIISLGRLFYDLIIEVYKIWAK